MSRWEMGMEGVRGEQEEAGEGSEKMRGGRRREVFNYGTNRQQRPRFSNSWQPVGRSSFSPASLPPSLSHSQITSWNI